MKIIGFLALVVSLGAHIAVALFSRVANQADDVRRVASIPADAGLVSEDGDPAADAIPLALLARAGCGVGVSLHRDGDGQSLVGV